MGGPEHRAPLSERLRAGADFIRHRTEISGDQSPSRERLLPGAGSPATQSAAASGSGGVLGAMGPSAAARDEDAPADYAELNRQPDKLWGSLLGDVAGPLVSWVLPERLAASWLRQARALWLCFKPAPRPGWLLLKNPLP